MIGVAANHEELEIAREFFELFKTSWEPAVPGRRYDAIVTTCDRTDHLEADLVIVYGAATTELDREAGVSVTQTSAVEVGWHTWIFPVFGRAVLFPRRSGAILDADGGCLDYVSSNGRGRRQRVGYNLFAEIRHLLTAGQPDRYASIPTLELHIALLRHWLVEAGVPFVEVLPRPSAHDFICCLTHDIDFVGVRRHLFDRTMAGFMARALFGTLFDAVRGRRPAGDVIRNLKAVCALPFVFAGLARELWRPFDDYAAIEDPRHSTFFVVPFRDRPGSSPSGKVEPLRAVRYQLSEIAADVRAAAERGSEIGIHGIDAWRDSGAAGTERQELSPIVPTAPGIRMHWLYFSDAAPNNLEQGGFAYDSTWGYNSRVGYRAGTTQVFHLPGTGLPELPLAIMDSALLSPDRMALSQDDALAECRRIIGQVRQAGGTLVINWHCRSLAPERLWDTPYRRLLKELGAGDRTWFTTARTAVDWFQWRRSVQLSEARQAALPVVRLSAPSATDHAALVRVHRAHSYGAVEDFAFDGSTPTDVWLAPASFTALSGGAERRLTLA